MPEIWLNYGSTEVALDIKAENLEEKIDVEGKTLSDSEIKSKLGSLDISKPTEFVVLNMSESIKKILSTIFEIYEQKSIPKPTILADRKIMNVIKNYLPEHSSISEFSNVENSDSKLVFIGEMEFDGLFGYETISTRLLKKFGTELMLSAYEKRKGDSPSPGQNVESFQTARKFSDILRSLETENVTLEISPKDILIKSGKSKFRVSTLNPDDFPVITDDPADSMKIDSEALLKLVNSTSFSMGYQDARHFINGLYVEFSQSDITAVATDGHRLAYSSSACELPSSGKTCIVPRKCINELKRILS